MSDYENKYLKKLNEVIGDNKEASISKKRISDENKIYDKISTRLNNLIFCGNCGNKNFECLYGIEGHCNIGGGGEWEFYCSKCNTYTFIKWEWSD
jgi:hypothetical protein